VYSLDRLAYLGRIARHDPAELIRLGRIGLATARLRFVKRCIGPGSVVGIGATVVNAANVRMGRRVLLQDYVYVRAGTEGRVTIGDRVAINSYVRLFGHGGITIGADTQIGPGTLITTTGHDYRGELAASFTPVVIGERVWIGANVTVLPGVEIGDETVVGAGTIVNRSLPPRVVAVGNPARIVREIPVAPAPNAAASAEEGRGRERGSPATPARGGVAPAP
jgi:acetyltransferase-like isoleucine patch superfamily enzyme